MTKQEVRMAMRLALSGQDLSAHDTEPLFGCALPDFKPVVVSMETVARFLRCQVVMLNGQVDENELNDLAPILRSKVMLWN